MRRGPFEATRLGILPLDYRPCCFVASSLKTLSAIDICC